MTRARTHDVLRRIIFRVANQRQLKTKFADPRPNLLVFETVGLSVPCAASPAGMGKLRGAPAVRSSCIRCQLSHRLRHAVKAVLIEQLDNAANRAERIRCLISKSRAFLRDAQTLIQKAKPGLPPSLRPSQHPAALAFH